MTVCYDWAICIPLTCHQNLAIFSPLCPTIITLCQIHPLDPSREQCNGKEETYKGFAGIIAYIFSLHKVPDRKVRQEQKAQQLYGKSQQEIE